jgi:hypothetical protein
MNAVLARSGCPLTTRCSCPMAPYPFGQTKHLAYKVEGNPRGLLYNYQVVGKHPVTRFSSQTFQPHTRPGLRFTHKGERPCYPLCLKS